MRISKTPLHFHYYKVQAVLNTSSGTMHDLAHRCNVLYHSSPTVPGRSELLTTLRNYILDACCLIGDSGNLASGTELIAALSTLR